MTPQRRLVLGLAAVVGALGLGVLVASAIFGGDDGGDGASDVAAGGSTTTASGPAPTVPETTTTTFDLVPEPVPTTVPPPSTTSTTAAPAPVVSAAGAVLRAPSGARPLRQMTGDDCTTLAASGWSGECGVVVGKGGGRLVWLVESKPKSVGSTTTVRRAYVLVPAGSSSGPGSGSSWRVSLEALDEDGVRWKSVAVRAIDVSEDGADEIVYGFRAATGEALAVDLVEGPAPGSVTAHIDLRQGSARVSVGQLDAWSHVSGSGATARFQHDLIRWRDNAWRVVSRTQVAGRDVPPSHF